MYKRKSTKFIILFCAIIIIFVFFGSINIIYNKNIVVKENRLNQPINNKETLAEKINIIEEDVDENNNERNIYEEESNEAKNKEIKNKEINKEIENKEIENKEINKEIENKKVNETKGINIKSNLNNDSNNQKIRGSFRNKSLGTDMEYILNYKGGELEPEWQWTKNISVVYTWVDGNDIDFLDIKSKFNGGFRKYNSRDRSVDELRYSIRSLVKYMPWHNGTFYIVTNKQIPKWLDTTNPRIKMVYDEEFLPEHMAPSFDSNAIELYLDKLPGITEYFLYFNDDFFLNNYVHPCFFFTKNGFYPKIYRGYGMRLNKDKIDRIIKKNKEMEKFEASKYFTRAITREYFDPNALYRYYLHTPYVIYRDLMEPFRQLFKEEIKLICADRFRSYYEPHSLYLYQNYLFYATGNDQFPLKLGGKGKASLFEGSPLPEKSDRTVKKYSCMMVPWSIGKKLIRFGSITNNYNSNVKKFNKFKNDKNLLVYNFNDEYSKINSSFQLSEYMIARYPEPSPFEKKEYVDLELSIEPLFEKVDNLFNILKYNITENFQNNRTTEFLKALKDYELDMVSEYIEKKAVLSDPQLELSHRETEEIKFINSYKGKKLTKAWKWASSISLVYIYEGISKDQNKNTTITESEKLKYSIRSVEKFLPWFKGTIYIVTQTKNSKKDSDLQWLNHSNDRIKIVNQNTIIPKKLQTSENKNIIHMYLDKIPGISERFIYLKNNHYFIHYTHPRFFFSPEFYPKYNLGKPLEKKKIKKLNKNDPPFYNSNEIILKYFGHTYFKSYRYFLETPIPLYRDLFEPARQLFHKEVNEKNRLFTNGNILPLYLITNYNIYGAAQLYYPEYVAGYGDVRKAKAPNLNPKRTIDFYGFDITSQFIADATIVYDLIFKEVYKSNSEIINKIKNISNERMFSIKFLNEKKYSLQIKEQYETLMNDIYTKKSSFENH